MQETISREKALALLRAYNQETFHIQHALTVEGVMDYFARELGYGEEADFWALAGLLHDIDFEQWPDQHCQKAPELLREAGASDEMIHAIVSHGCGLCADVCPTGALTAAFATQTAEDLQLERDSSRFYDYINEINAEE